jgi:hypothetical protein
MDLPALSCCKALGRRQLATGQSKWDAFSRAMALILNPSIRRPNELLLSQAAMVDTAV